MALLAGCSDKKPEESKTDAATTSPVITEDASIIESISEEEVTPEYVDEYTVELKDDEVIEIN